MNTSKLRKEDFNFRATEIKPNDIPIDKAQATIHNSYLALCFSEAISAKNNYQELLKIYEELNDAEKSKVFNEITKIYNYTKTILSWL
jgi:hypothetical protein